MRVTLGFHLLEILITLAIVAILATIAIPRYSQYVVQTYRLSAANTLQEVANALERYFIEHNTYRGATLSALHFSKSIVHDQYQLVLSSATADNFLISAKPVTQQLKKDQLCGTLNLDALNRKTVSGIARAEDCW